MNLKTLQILNDDDTAYNQIKHIVDMSNENFAELDNIDVSVDKIIYTNPQKTNIANVKDALDYLLYFNPTISISCTQSGVKENGNVIVNPIINWSYNKSIISQTLNGTSIDINIKSYKVTENITKDSDVKSWVVRGYDGTNYCSGTVSISFTDALYWGVSNQNTYNSAFINSLSNKELSFTKSKTITVNATAGNFIYYCLPTSYGTPKFTIGGFEGGFTKIQTINYTNVYNYTTSYDIWKSNNSGLGNTTVNIV